MEILFRVSRIILLLSLSLVFTACVGIPSLDKPYYGPGCHNTCMTYPCGGNYVLSCPDNAIAVGRSCYPSSYPYPIQPRIHCKYVKSCVGCGVCYRVKRCIAY